MSSLYEVVLLFPEKAENLGQFSAYDVDLQHWKKLSSAFQQTFRTVYERGSSAVLLVHGAQGTGKTLFSMRLEQDFHAASRGALEPGGNNLWHHLVGEDPPTRATIERATQASHLQRVEPTGGWLSSQRNFAKVDKQSRVRIFVIDDATRAVFLHEWAGLSYAEYLDLKARGHDAVALTSVAERLVEDCRGDFKRSIFLLLSNNAERMKQLKLYIDQSHRGLASELELPLPAPEEKERIIRKNINRLNRVSYWFCLDAAPKREREAVYEVLHDEDKGFTDSFVAVDQAFRTDVKRTGRPANRNLITLVTLGAPPGVAKAFIDERGLDAIEHHRSAHFGIWWMKQHWASTLYEGSDPELSRRAKMVESEFSLRWVTLDMTATYALYLPQERLDDLGERLLEIIRFFPSIAKPDQVDAHRADCARLDAALDADPWSPSDLSSFEEQLQNLGQRRSVLYERALLQRLGSYGQGFKVFPEVRPDHIADEYRPCAVTAARSKDPAAISDVIRRTCHAIEFTSHLRSDLEGLDKYILQKVERYALLLESV